jgi:formylglycine-generating enzyme required for sulfatase activity
MTRKIFISYRRKDSQEEARAIFERLAASFVNEVYWDGLNELGEDYADRITRELAESCVLIAIIGPDWACSERQHDYVHMEIEQAIRQSLLILPVLVRGANQSTLESLPLLVPLPLRSRLPRLLNLIVDPENPEPAYALLVTRIRKCVIPASTPSSAPTQSGPPPSRSSPAAAPQVIQGGLLPVPEKNIAAPPLVQDAVLPSQVPITPALAPAESTSSLPGTTPSTKVGSNNVQALLSSAPPPAIWPQSVISRHTKFGLMGALIVVFLIAATIWLPITHPEPLPAPQQAKPDRLAPDCTDAYCPALVLLKATAFSIGVERSEFSLRTPRQPVTLAADVYITATEITLGAFRAYARENPVAQGASCKTLLGDGKFGESPRSTLTWQNTGFPQTDSHPVVCVSWFEARDFAVWFSKKTKQHYRLPTEAEWELAARELPIDIGEAVKNEPGKRVCDYGNLQDRSLLEARRIGDPASRGLLCTDEHAFTREVGQGISVAGMSDMIGNAAEWVQDCWHDSFRGYPTQSDASVAWESGCDPEPTKKKSSAMVARGGSWMTRYEHASSKHRGGYDPNERSTTIGFRLVREVK